MPVPASVYSSPASMNTQRTNSMEASSSQARNRTSVNNRYIDSGYSSRHSPSFAYDNAESIFAFAPHPAPPQFGAHEYQHPVHSNPYPVHPPAQSPPVQQKVWILDCKSCDTFLTNRGMKAVLLLSPNISLFSTDALPVNCTAFCADSDARSSAACNNGSSSQNPPRTCECLTQTLCCHGCGTGVGYMIVIPCSRCTTSITANNKATNGHRFVFHSTEIVCSERHYVEDEPSVIIPELPAQFQFVPGINRDQTPTWHPYLPSPPLEGAESASRSSSPSLSSTSSTPSLPDLISAYSTVDSYLVHTSVSPYVGQVSQQQTSQQYYDLHFQSAGYSVPPYSFPSQLHMPQPHDPKPTEESGMNTQYFDESMHLKAGDVLYWHHLKRHGEIPGVMEDERARFGKNTKGIVASFGI